MMKSHIAVPLQITARLASRISQAKPNECAQPGPLWRWHRLLFIQGTESGVTPYNYKF